MANSPIKKLKHGQIEVAIWQGEYDGKPTYSISAQKSYKPKEGDWKTTTFFDDKEALILANLLRRASDFISDTKEAAKGGGSSDGSFTTGGGDTNVPF